MGQFKPMVKMFTDEPSVILKLKKGGKVASKAAEQSEGFKSMANNNAKMYEDAECGVAPKKPSMAERRKSMNPNQYKMGGKVAKHEDAAQDRAMIKKALAGKKFASGGEIDKADTKTTIKSNAGKFVNTKMVDGDKADKAHGTKGIKESNAGGFKMGGTIEGNAGKFAKTKMVDGDKADKAHGTGNVKMGNAGGFKMGGKVPGLGNAVEGGDWENRPADTAKPGKVNGTTGGVRESNAGGYKKGGAAKKHYATGGNVVSDGKAEKMPRHFVSRPVANSLQSGTFKKGGKVGKYAEGDLVDASKGAYDKATGPSSEDMDMAKAIRSIPSKLYQGAKSMMGFGSSAAKPAGSVTKTEKSVTVSPGKKRGGSC